MAKPQVAKLVHKNQLFGAFSPEARDRILPHMNAATRTSVTLAAQSLQNQGLISDRRGMMQIRDRAGLEAVTCECYAIVKARFDAFLSPPASAVQEAKSGRIQGS